MKEMLCAVRCLKSERPIKVNTKNIKCVKKQKISA